MSGYSKEQMFIRNMKTSYSQNVLPSTRDLYCASQPGTSVCSKEKKAASKSRM